MVLFHDCVEQHTLYKLNRMRFKSSWQLLCRSDFTHIHANTTLHTKVIIAHQQLMKWRNIKVEKSLILQNITLQAWLRAVFDWVSKSNWFWITMLHDWLKELGPIFCPIRSKTNTNRDFPAQVFPRFAPETCKYFSFDWVTGWPVFFVIGPTG